MMSLKLLKTVSVLMLLSGWTCAGDWSHWRGPTYNGVSDGPALVDGFPDGGPRKLWESEPLSPHRMGYSSVAIADGRAYTFVHALFTVPIPERAVPGDLPARFGYIPAMPKELVDKVEQARVSDERAKVDRRQMRDWLNTWTKENLDKDSQKYKRAVETRLQAGADALPLEVCAKLDALAGKTFPDQDAFDAAMKEIGLDDDVAKQVARHVPTTKNASSDHVVCLNAETGETLWRKDLPSWFMWYAGSCTPTIVDGKCYVLSSEAKVWCLDAKTGTEIWQSEQVCHPGARQNTHNRSSSVLLVDGVAVVTTRSRTAGLDAATGKVLWTQDRFGSEYGSAVPCVSGGRTVAVFVGGGKVVGLDPKTGEIVWSVTGGDGSTATLAGDLLVVTTGKKLIGYRLGGEKPESLWEVDFVDGHTAPIIHDGAVYVFGEAYSQAGKGRAMCVDAATGQVKWNQVLGPHQHSSPVVADGKLVAVGGDHLYLVKATPDTYVELGKVRLGLEKWASVAVADGKVYLRTPRTVVCCDLRRQP